MLKAERAARRITHPHASYTSDGKLLCNLCETLVKSEAQWGSHLHSTQHTLRSQRAQDAKATRGEDGSKKRKAETLEVESPAAVEKKRVRSNQVEEDEVEDVAGPEDVKEADGNDLEAIPPVATGQTADQPTTALDPDAPLDEAELAAFEADLAALEAESRNQTALDAAATISAAPMTAEQLAAQAREEASEQKGKRDREIEEEREEAEVALQEEFEEMEGLEERVRRLRERREALRKGKEGVGVREEAGEEAVDANGGGADGGSEDVEEDEEEDEWKFGGS